MKILAVRHGETEWNVERREMGQLDSPLTRRGVEQARALADRLRRIEVEHCYSSDLGRAVATAEIIASACRVGLTTRADLREHNMGIFQGLTVAQQREKYPAEREAYERGRFDYVIPKGESGRQRQERSVRAMCAIGEEAIGNRVAVVTHGAFLRGFFEYVLGVPPGDGTSFRRDNASYNSFEYVNGRWRLGTWNDTSHLLEPGDAPAFEPSAIAQER